MRARWEGRYKDVRHDRMTCVVCVLLLRALCRGGGSEESEDDVTEMMSSGSGAQFLLLCVEGGRGIFLMRDVEG